MNFTRVPLMQDILVGGKAVFNCRVDSVPPATITWYHNNVLVSNC